MHYVSLTLKDTSETVRDCTAVIFQHECDHLDGILYTDKVER
ncbi:MAG: peptide deformylase [Bacteroidales bacterium]|nr:peptide deformylase [Candidatus Cryptobacteroides onthequi]